MVKRNKWSPAVRGSLSLHKEKAWTAYSLYIRTRDCLKTTGTLEKGSCVTCLHLCSLSGAGGLQAGHFIAGRGNSLLFDERNCHGQCPDCNMFEDGAHAKYLIFMKQNYGKKIIEELQQKRHKAVKFTISEFDDMTTMYIAKREELLANPQLAHWELPVKVDSALPF